MQLVGRRAIPITATVAGLSGLAASTAGSAVLTAASGRSRSLAAPMRQSVGALRLLWAAIWPSGPTGPSLRRPKPSSSRLALGGQVGALNGCGGG